MNFWVSCPLVLSIGFSLLAIGFSLPAFASPKQEVRLTQVIQDVQVVTADGAAHTTPAQTNSASQVAAASVKPGSDAIPAFTDLGTIETRASAPNPASGAVGVPAVNPATGIPR